MLDDYLSGEKFIALFTLIKNEINNIRESRQVNLPAYSGDEFKKMFRKEVIKLGLVCDRELDDPKLAPAMEAEIKAIRKEGLGE